MAKKQRGGTGSEGGGPRVREDGPTAEETGGEGLHDAPAAKPKFEAQEIEFLPKREGRPMSAELAQNVIVQLRVLSKKNDKSRAEFEHEAGTLTKVLYGGIAEVAKDAGSFAALMKRELGWDRRRTWDFADVAHHATERQASEYGIEKLRLALEIRRRLGTHDLTDLEKRDLLTELGDAVRTDSATVAELRSVLRKLDAKPDEKVSKTLRDEISRGNDAWNEERKNEDVLRQVKAEFIPQDRKAKLRVSTPLDAEQLLALQRVIARLQRRGILKPS